MSKAEFIKVFELTLVSANLDIIGLTLIDDNHVLITFKGNGTRKVNIEGDSYGAIIQDTMKYAFWFYYFYYLYEKRDTHRTGYPFFKENDYRKYRKVDIIYE